MKKFTNIVMILIVFLGGISPVLTIQQALPGQNINNAYKNLSAYALKKIQKTADFYIQHSLQTIQQPTKLLQINTLEKMPNQLNLDTLTNNIQGAPAIDLKKFATIAPRSGGKAFAFITNLSLFIAADIAKSQAARKTLDIVEKWSPSNAKTIKTTLKFFGIKSA